MKHWRPIHQWRNPAIKRLATRDVASSPAETLESRVLLSTFTVTSRADAGPGSLREAITFANNSLGRDTIAFDIPGPARAVIHPLSPLPPVVEQAVIDGTTQAGWSAGNPVVELDGSAASSGLPVGLLLSGSSTLRGLAIYGWSGAGTGAAVQLTGSGNLVEGNRIGLDAIGAPRANDFGVIVAGSQNTVGAVAGTAATRNVIAASTVAGVRVGRVAAPDDTPWRNTIAGNFIGTSADGAGDAGNATGVLLDGLGTSAAQDTSILDNVVSGNGVGVRIAGPGAVGSFLDGNAFGLSAAGASLPNDSHGVWVTEGATRNRVGDEATPGFSNRIRHNGGDGVRLDFRADSNIVQSNQIGGNAGSGVFLYEADFSLIRSNLIGGIAPSRDAQPTPDGNGQRGITLGTYSTFNQVLANTIAFNAGAGVFVALLARENAVLRNGIYRSSGAGIEGGYRFSPVIHSVVSTDAATFVWGSLAAEPVAGYRVEFFATDPATGVDPGGPFGVGLVEGQRYVGSVEPRTDEAGHTLFFAELPALPAGTLVTATASRAYGEQLETSPFSAPLSVPARGEPPGVAQVFMRSTAWTPEFLQYLQRVGLGSTRFGYAVPAASVPSYPQDDGRRPTLPWVDLDQAYVAFTEPVSADLGDLLLVRADGTGYHRDAFTYDTARRVGGWTLEPRVTKGRLTLRVDGNTSRAVVDAAGNKLDGDGNGTSGPDFRLQLNVLPGDADRAGDRVDGSDVAEVRSRVGRTSREPVGHPNPYSIFADLDGDGRIDAADYLAARRRVGDSLPPPATGATSAGVNSIDAAAPAARRNRPATRSALAELLR